jgi:urease accessory protein
MQTLIRLLHLVSPTLPIGSYAYSQGLEQAVERGWVKDPASLAEWCDGLLRYSLGQVDIPILHRCYPMWRAEDMTGVRYWSQMLLACRETAELRAEERIRGGALMRLLAGLDMVDAACWASCPDVTVLTGFSLAASRWQIALNDAAQGYAWSWLENQVLAGMKLIPLGQTAGQRVLFELAEAIPAVVAQGFRCDDDEIGAAAPALAIASSWHETQYTRIFRS